MFFAGKLKEIRTENALTQAELAEECGIATNTINRWENGANFPGYRNIANLANALKISALDFLDEDNTNKAEIKEIKKAYRMQQNMLYSVQTNKVVDPTRINEIKEEDPLIQFRIDDNKTSMQAIEQLDVVLHTLAKDEYNEYLDNTPKSEEKKSKMVDIVGSMYCLNIRGLSLVWNLISEVLANDPDYNDIKSQKKKR